MASCANRLQHQALHDDDLVAIATKEMDMTLQYGAGPCQLWHYDSEPAVSQ